MLARGGGGGVGWLASLFDCSSANSGDKGM